MAWGGARMTLKELYRLVRTLRHFPPRKLFARLRMRLRRRTLPNLASTHTVSVAECLASPWGCSERPGNSLLFDEWAWTRPENEAYRKSRVQSPTEDREGWLLNRPFRLPDNPDGLKDLLEFQTPLWRENYGYLEFLLPLVREDSPENAALLLEQWQCWRALPDAERLWSTYGVARRLVTACQMIRAIRHFPEEARKGFLDDLFAESSFVHQFIERDVGGNHLVLNLKALLAVSILFQSHPASGVWRKLLNRELVGTFESQILPDGGHFERTPMYHAWVLRDLLDCLAMSHMLPDEPAWYRSLRELAPRMLATLETLAQASEQLPDFGDSSPRQTPSVPLLKTFAKLIIPEYAPRYFDALPSISYLPQSGFAVFRVQSPQASLVIDCGDFGPRDLPAHSHCDLGNFEAHVGKLPVIIDSGVAEYAPGPQRDYFRGTGAHNTVWFPGEEQAEIWSSFRVAEYPRHLGAEFRETESGATLSLAYEDFARRYRHRRHVEFVDNRFWIVSDRVTRLRPATGPGYSLLHIVLDCLAVAGAFLIDDRMLIIPWGPGPTEHATGPWLGNLNLYSEGFQLPEPGGMLAQSLVFSGNQAAPCGWILIPVTEGGHGLDLRSEEAHITLTDADRSPVSYALDWRDTSANGGVRWQRL